jgi:hypothetical protein
MKVVWWKGALWVLLGLWATFVTLVVGALALFALWLALTIMPRGVSRQVETTSTSFLALLGEGKTQQAYQSAASTLQTRENEAAFTARMRRMGLTDYASVSWQHRRMQGRNRGYLEGNVTTRKGRVIRVVMILFEEGGAWKVESVSTLSAYSEAPG